MDCRTAPIPSATAVAGTGSRFRKTILRRCWRPRSCRRARSATPDWAARSGSPRRRRAWACAVLRLNSCSGTPCKVVIRLAKRSVHARRLVRGQNLLPPVLQRRRRRTAAEGGNVERPAEMLARMAQADAQAVEPADFVIERADM